MYNLMYIPQGLPPMKGLTSQSQENIAMEPLDHPLKAASKITHSLARKTLGMLGKCVVYYHRSEVSLDLSKQVSQVK